MPGGPIDGEAGVVQFSAELVHSSLQNDAGVRAFLDHAEEVALTANRTLGRNAETIALIKTIGDMCGSMEVTRSSDFPAIGIGLPRKYRRIARAKGRACERDTSGWSNGSIDGSHTFDSAFDLQE